MSDEKKELCGKLYRLTDSPCEREKGHPGCHLSPVGDALVMWNDKQPCWWCGKVHEGPCQEYPMPVIIEGAKADD